MSQADADTIRHAFEAWNEEGPEAVVERFWTEDAVYREMPGWPDAGVFRGREEVLERMRGLVEFMGPTEVSLEDLIETDDGRLVAVVRMVGAADEGATSYTQSFAVVHRMREGRVAEADYYLEPAHAFDATGINRA